MVKNEIKKIEKILRELSTLKQFKEVKALKKRLRKDLESITKKEKPIIPKVSSQEKQIQANERRSSFMKKKWNYIKQIYANYPEIREQYSLREIFQMYSKRKNGEQIPIGDVYWQNPSQ